MSLNQYDEISRLLLAYSAGEYDYKGSVSSDVNDLDMIISGINMLGEELQSANVSRDFFLSIFNTVADLVFVVDKEGVIMDVNKAVEHLLGKPKKLLVSKSIESYLTSKAIFSKIKKVLVEENDVYSFESDILQNRKRLLIGSFTATKLFKRSGEFNGYLIAVRNITEQKQHEQQILQTIFSTQQKEQKRVADDLHDSLGQELSMTKLMLTNLQKFGKENAEFTELLTMCQEMLDGSIAHLREICFDLMPNVLIQGGLPAALKDLVDRLDALDDIGVELNIDDDFPRLSVDMEIVVYRMVQEFINNMIKHSSATKLFVNLYELSQDKFAVELEENGQGFDIGKLSKPRENRGYSNMMSNIKAFGGEYNLESEKNVGTKLSVKFPKLYEQEH